MTKFFLQKLDGSHEPVSEADFRKVYGAFGIRNLTPEVPGWRISALMDIIDAPAGTSVFVRDTDGRPMEGVPVQMYYSTATLRPGSAPPNGLPIGVTARGDLGETNAEGHSGWAWGDAYYFPHDDDLSKRRGPYCYWIPDGKPCESIDGVGMIGGTNHRRYDIWFQYVTHGEPIPPEPPDPPGPGTELEERVTSLEVEFALLHQAIGGALPHLESIVELLEECDDD